ncbi:MAG TPA: hypothetical protein VNL91_00610, partial [Thermoanaerobaculia bacterium]|nr:hypothetical protein [Thermoanaerobaculia bacterium]
VASSRRVRATAFDFGPVRGHAKLTMKYVPPFSRLVNVRFANVREELFHLEGTTHPFVFAAGERTLIDPRLRSFRYIIVYGGEANAEVVREPASQ